MAGKPKFEVGDEITHNSWTKDKTYSHYKILNVTNYNYTLRLYRKNNTTEDYKFDHNMVDDGNWYLRSEYLIKKQFNKDLNEIIKS